MILNETPLIGAFVVQLQPKLDERGFFARAWCAREFADHRLVSDVAQLNLSYSSRKATLRGMHYQVAPYEEVKVVGCVRGTLYDVIIDLRPDSATYKGTFGLELSAANRKMLYVPAGFAHGFETLEDDTEVLYLISSFYTPTAERGIRYDDPAFGIEWPLPVAVLSEKDAAWPRY